MSKDATPAIPPALTDGRAAELDPDLRTQLEAAAFRRLVAHLRDRTDVQNIDLMNLSGFCRNCLSKWYAAAAAEHGVQLDKLEAREIVYGMPFDQWKDRYQQDATPAQKEAFDRAHRS